MRNSILFLFIALLFFTSCDEVVLQGTLTVRGNEPHTQLVLASEDGTAYSLTGPMAKDLYRHQYHRVTVRGKIISKAADPGFPATLQVTKILTTGSP